MVENIQILNSRGLKLSAILSTPDNQANPPIVLMLQGFLGKKDGTKLNSLSERLLDVGISSIRFDYAGYGTSEGETQNEYLVSKIVSDIEDVLKYVKRHSKINTSRIGIWGQSMGGMLAIITASLHNEIKAVCAISAPPTITLDDDLEKKIQEWQENGFLERFNSNGDLVRVTYKFVEDARKWNASELVKKVASPKLFIVGEKDQTVPPENTIKIYNSALGDKKLIEVPEMPHEYNQNPKFIDIVNDSSVAYFQKHLFLI